LVFSASFAQDEEEFGVMGELQEMALKQFPVMQTQEELAGLPGESVKALMIGITKFDPPDNPEWDIYHFYDYYWKNSPERWIGFVVVNYSNYDVNCRVQMELCYNEGQILWKKSWKKNIQENRAILYYIKTTRPNKIGLYSVRGKLYGAKGLGAYNEVKTNYYIYEIW
jgi:hypothetical protein